MREKLLGDVVDEQIDVTTKAFMGLTVACARCHDHKFDPIPTKDYYALAGIYNGSDLKTRMVASAAEIERFNKAQQPLKAKEADIQKWLGELARQKKLKGIPKDQENKLLSDAEKKELAGKRAEVDAFRKTMPPTPPEVHVITGGGKEMKVYIRGNPMQQGEP